MRTDHDVLIIGAGISGIGVACRLAMRRPGTDFAVLESREDLGGTWDLFRYPGIRSDSDLQTFAFDFKPWTSENMIADGHEIQAYLREAAEEHSVLPRIRFGHTVEHAEYSSDDGRWTVRCVHDGETIELTARWLVGASGYYDRNQGFAPEFPRHEEFEGEVVHPQAWPEDLDYDDKRVVVIGSGATAVTLVPAMAKRAGHVTMLQRSPSYIVSVPRRGHLAIAMRKVLPDAAAHAVVRRVNIALWRGMWKLSKSRPGTVRRVIRALTRRQLPAGHPIDVDFKPAYDPWDQRLCAVPDGDLFRAISAGRASVATERIARFTPGGVLLGSGRELEADVIVTATGLTMRPLGGLELHVGGQPVAYPDTVTFRSMMLSGVPNFAYVLGYTNIAWTLKVDLMAEHFCRLLDYMDASGYDTVVPEADPNIGTEHLFDGFESNYMKRSVADWPRQGTEGPWTAPMDMAIDRARLGRGAVQDPALRFGTVSVRDQIPA